MKATVYHAAADVRVESAPVRTCVASPILDLDVDLAGVSRGYAAMDERAAIEVLVGV